MGVLCAKKSDSCAVGSHRRDILCKKYWTSVYFQWILWDSYDLQFRTESQRTSGKYKFSFLCLHGTSNQKLHHHIFWCVWTEVDLPIF